ncbi:WD repeat-containing protein 3 isoform X2 [Bradysia coprophila]|uniref:WD repeat-containing protein 3 isoform X2 n=1 Tax=Bradysia coprophila TaxID=38358 RepID=UPI00187D8BD2|nr:WD repeat-containing protein 3 isoform X2 [Bradysia coprophila]
MGLTKQYLAHRAAGKFNIIASGRSNVVFVNVNKTDGRYVAVGAAENTYVWDVRLGEKTIEIDHEKNEVTTLRPSPDKLHIAVGYSNGSIEIFNLLNRNSICLFTGHRNAVNVLRYDKLGMLLLSGGNDNDIVVYDVVDQLGKCRLTGHTAPVTDACFYEPMNDVVITSSKDTQIKFWDIETQYCFMTIVDHRSDVWALSLVRDSQYLVTGSGDSALNIYKISENEKATEENRDNDEDTDNSPLKCKLVGTIQRAGRGRTVNLVADPTGRVIGCHGTDDMIELFYFCTDDEATARLTKRLKKLSVENKSNLSGLSLTDEVKRLAGIKTQCKVKSIDLLMGVKNELRVVSTHANNSMKMFSLNIMEKKAEAMLLKSLTHHGHQSEVRSLSFSSDGMTIASASGDSLKVWNRQTLACIRTIEHNGYVLCSCFVPDDRHVLLGLKTGFLLIVDIITGDILEEIPAHTSELWSICLTPDSKGCVTGGGDATVKVWSFELVEDESTGDKSNVLSLLHKNTLKLEETVLCVKISPNNKFIAVGLLDSTVKIFFLDSFKFYLSLYGHKLPVLCLDISSDSSIIATGSADRNVKIWGMDFGDCHRSLFAHDDSVMALQFIPNTHMFWTCGKDGKIKQWDGDIFEKIITLPGHIGEAYHLAVDSSGHNLVTCGSDRVIRLFERTDEMIVLRDVQEDEREEIENRTLATGEDTTVPGLPNLKLPSKKTVGAERATESILECLEVSEEFDSGDSTDPPPLMKAYGTTNTIDYLIKTLTLVRASDLEESMLLLPFESVCKILSKMPELIEQRPDQTELLSKIVLFLFRIHQRPIVANQTLLPITQKIITTLQANVIELRDMIGLNYHGLQLLKRDIEAKEGVELFRDATKTKKIKEKKHKQRQLTKRLNIQMS